jgi:serine/threonine-protein kinase
MARKCSTCNGSFMETALYCPHDGTPLKNEENQNALENFIGKVLDSKYQIQHLIGEGGMGNVYQAKHLHIGFPVAVKILHPKLVKDSTAVERFRREARSARTIAHPNAVQVMDFGITSDNILYLVMELINGISLQKVLDNETILDTTRAISIMKQVCLAVDVAHTKSIIHRDLKPDNILVIDAGTPLETVKVIDFSIAKIKQGSDDPNITSAGIAVGTPKYISPEQAQGLKDIDSRADIYSLGVILYQMLTGKLPFEGKTVAMTLIQHIQTKPKALRELNPNIPIELEKVVLKALAKIPSERQQSAAMLAEELTLSLASPNSLITNIMIPIVNKADIENKLPINESDIATKIALTAITPKKPIAKEVKATNSKEVYQKSGKLLTNDKDNILPSFQKEPKKTFWQRLFSWFTMIFNH